MLVADWAVTPVAMVPDRADSVAAELTRLCERAVLSLPVTGAGLSVVARDNQFGLVAAADPLSERLEELQFVLGEGPCVDAVAAGQPVLVPDLTVDGPVRWPVYAPSIMEAGFRAVFAFPLQVGSARMGVLDLFRVGPGILSVAELVRTLALAEEAIAILLDGEARGGRESATTGPAELFQAQGMAMVQLDSTLADAMARIRAYAYVHNRRLSDVAREILAHELRFDRDG